MLSPSLRVTQTKLNHLKKIKNVTVILTGNTLLMLAARAMSSLCTASFSAVRAEWAKRFRAGAVFRDEDEALRLGWENQTQSRVRGCLVTTDFLGL
jgi:hypothetical protein